MKASLISHVRRNRKALLAVSAATLTAMPFLSSAGFGFTYKTWTGAISSDFEIAGNWSPSGVPSNTTSSSGAIVVFTGTPTANLPTLSKDRSLYGVLFDSAGWTLDGSFSLTMGGAGIVGSTNVSGSNTLSINTVTRTSVNTPIASGYSGSTLTVNSLIAGTPSNYAYGRTTTPGPEYGGTVVLTAQSANAGSPNILDSTLSVSSINSVFTNPTLGTVHSATSNLGSPLTYGNGQMILRSSDTVNVTEPRLLYTGAGEITDRYLYMSTAVATGGDNRLHTIQNDGTGSLVFLAAPLSAAANNIWNLSGSNTDANRMAGMIGDATGFTMTNRGSGYSTMPTMTITGDGSGAAGTFSTLVRGLVLTSGGSGYTSAPTVTVDAGAVNAYTTTSGFASVSLTADSSIGGAGNLTVNSPISGISGSFGLTKIGEGVTTLAGDNSYNGTTTVKAGRLVLANDGTSSAWTPVLSNPGGADVQAGRLVFDYTGSATTPAATVLSILTAGYGQGIKFSSGAIRTSNTPDAAKGLGWMDDAASHQVIVAYTYFGDANLDGQVDISDLGALATSWQTSAVWSQGDFDYSGFVDISDQGMLATNWQLGVGAPLSPSFDEALASVGLAGVSVPEPTSVALLGLCLAGMASRRHRREAAAAKRA